MERDEIHLYIHMTEMTITPSLQDKTSQLCNKRIGYWTAENRIELLQAEMKPR